jgi:outer membrane PBP1 activator LpoA protein
MQLKFGKYLAIILMASVIVGCVPPGVIKEPPEKPVVDPMAEEAKRLDAEGSHLDAANLYEQLAARYTGEARQAFLLSAAESYFRAEEADSAARILAQTDTASLPALDLRRRLLIADLALERSRPDEVLGLLAAPPPQDADSELVQRYHRLRAEAFRLAGNLLESANELEQLDAMLPDLETRLENQLAILQTLATLTDTALELLQPSPPGVRGGWMELARIIKAHANRPEEIQLQIAAWRERFPAHPALPDLLEGYFQKLKAQYRRANHLALLLPMNGPYRHAAKALMDGFMAAYFQDTEADRPQLVFYDSSNASETWPLYRQAVEAGADMIIGPLNKTGVSQLARAGELEVPVLALNQVPTEVTPPADLYQFGLSPEDEARQVAERAWLDGHTTAIVLTPGGDWGNRIFQAFSNRWERLGGTLAEHQTYDAREHDFTQPIRSMLNIDESYNRRKQLQQILGKKLEFEPRRRDDASFIFLAAKTEKARQIRPQLQFHHAADMPVYATSHIFSGNPDPASDQDLEGLKFPDIPWLLVAEGSEPLSRQSLGETFPESQDSGYRRLYAMGIDSYRMLPHLARLQSSSRESLDGKTGLLYLDGINQVRRQLVWAEMKGGSPRVLGYAPRLESDSGEVADIEQLPQQLSPPEGTQEQSDGTQQQNQQENSSEN